MRREDLKTWCSNGKGSHDVVLVEDLLMVAKPQSLMPWRSSIKYGIMMASMPLWMDGIMSC
jgi:hypothetical protein